VRKRSIFWIGGVIIGFILLVSLFLGISIRRSFPQVKGNLSFPELDGPVDIYRDQMGIPQIFATTEHDLFFAQGYVHAQDRFWQMDFWRHQGAGRLSEMMGEATLGTDIFLRTLGWERIAKQEIEMLDQEYLDVLEAYAAGVNAYLAERNGSELSLEYLFLNLVNSDYTPKPWEPLNTLTWQKAMAWDLGSGYLDLEIDRALLSKTLSAQEIDFLYPSYPEDHPVIVNNIGGEAVQSGSKVEATEYLEAVSPAFEELAQVLSDTPYLGDGGFPGIGSNSWAISGALTDTGMPYLANDPHLSQQMPSIWYQIGLHCVDDAPDCEIDVAGFSFAGAPGVIIGHNQHVAWGFTNVGPDVIDLYIEKINPDNPDQYQYRGNWVEMETYTEVIEVAGSEPYELTVQATSHGPIITSAYGLTDTMEGSSLDLPEQYAVSIRWTALEPSFVFPAIYHFNLAKDWDEFRTAAMDFSAPAQNLLYADVYGNIGYQMPGNIPLRAPGDEGKYPKPGWTGAYDWYGYIPFESLPYTLNPEEGYIVTANNAVVGPDYPFFITDDWSYGWRAQRIVDMVESLGSGITLADLQSMQGDNYNMIAEELIPVLMDVDFTEALLSPDLVNPEEIQAVKDQVAHLGNIRSMLDGWDYQNAIDSTPAAIFNVFWNHLVSAAFDDQLPEFYGVGVGGRSMELIRQLLDDPGNPWWDDTNTRITEDRDMTMALAFAQAMEELEEQHGSDPLAWKWGELHTITFTHGVMNNFPVINGLFNRGPYQAAGGGSIVNATAWSADSYEVNWLPSMRMVVDLNDLSNSFTVHTTGESGHAYAGHYADMADLWRLIEYYPMFWERSEIELNAASRLHLEP
jgi:penicillin amidase